VDNERLTELLRAVSFSADLPDEALRKLAGISHAHIFPAGSILFEERTQNKNLYLIWSGRVALDMNVPGHGNVRVLSLGPGDMVAWSAVLDQGEMTASAVATEDTEVVALPADKLLAQCQADPQLGYEIMLRIARQLARRLLATRVHFLELIAQQPVPSTSGRDGDAVQPSTVLLAGGSTQKSR
jgi:CRP/FNR family cyclic AMP-dependent transcriptional regulator